jgi:hypothetical protein
MMRKITLMILAVTSTLVLGGMVGANAATVTETYDFTAGPYSSGDPVSTWDGSFTITFNPTGGAVGPSALDAFSSNLPASYGTFTFVYDGASNPILAIGDNCSTGSCTITPGTDNALLVLSAASGGLRFTDASITSTSRPGATFLTDFGTVTLTPLPAALPLFATGLGALGLLGWRRKRKARVSLLGETAC